MFNLWLDIIQAILRKLLCNFILFNISKFDIIFKDFWISRDHGTNSLCSFSCFKEREGGSSTKPNRYTLKFLIKVQILKRQIYISYVRIMQKIICQFLGFGKRKRKFWFLPVLLTIIMRAKYTLVPEH